MPASPTATSPPGRVRHGMALWLGLLGLLLGWLPLIGVVLSAGAVGLWGWSHRKGRRTSALGLAVAGFGILVGALFTGLYFVVPPALDSAANQARWEAFDRLFDDPKEAGREP